MFAPRNQRPDGYGWNATRQGPRLGLCAVAMCGIVGVVPRLAPGNPEEINRLLGVMTHELDHRGPDNQDIWTDGAAFLGAARLAVLDLGPKGNQPMGDAQGLVRVVCNGEIYNYRTLRNELTSLGHVFSGQSDTEVIVHGYLAWGDGVLDKLRGMFALAIWDTRRQRLVLARDRVGKKPLCYASSGGDFVFASEVSALLRWPGLARTPNLEAIHHYLSFQYVPAPMTAFDGVSRLPPGHKMVVAPGAAPSLEPYATFPTPGDTHYKSREEASEELAVLLDDAVRVRMASDAPLGAFLSGGIDSSSIVALMSRHTNGKALKTFSLGFSEAAQDERPFAREVAQHFGTDHYEAEMQPSIAQLLPKIAWHYGDPFADSSALPTFCVAELAREHVTVALTGDGGDEVFFGYERYAAFHGLEWVRGLPMSARRVAACLASHLPADADGTRPLRVLRRLLARWDSNDTRRYASLMAYFEDHHKRDGYGETLRPYLAEASFDRLAPYFNEAPTMMSGAAWADFNTYLPDDLLVKLDIAAMGNSLETRCPFLDQNLLDWALKLPEAVRFSSGGPKSLLKSVMESQLPPATLRRSKRGFSLPLQQWLGNELQPLLREVLQSPRALGRGLFRPNFVEKMISETESGRFFHHTRLWAMLMLELWYVTWIDPPAGQVIAPIEL